MMGRAWLTLLVVIAPVAAQSQSNGTVDEIVVTAARADDRVEASTLVLDSEALAELQPVGTADVFRNLTGVSMRTNSRGESVVRVRGSEERQTLVFLDGTPLATPWDGRVDLALLPAGLVDRVAISRGVVPIEYGANAVAGAVDLSTFQPAQAAQFRVTAEQGTLGLQNVNVLGGVQLENNWSFVAGAANVRRDAERIADRDSVRFDPADGSGRSNTDLDGRSLYASASYAGDRLILHTSLLHADVERGIAAQSDLDPAVSNPRFWRSPEWRLTQAMFNGGWALTESGSVRLTAWRQWFDQTIDAYTDYSYTTLRDREQGDDDTSGARAVASFELTSGDIALRCDGPGKHASTTGFDNGDGSSSGFHRRFVFALPATADHAGRRN